VRAVDVPVRSPEAQAQFDNAMLYQHSFYYRRSQAEFEKVLQADPQCAVAYWGIALSLLYNPHAPPPPANLPLGHEAIEKGKAVGAKTQRERDYIDALSAMYADYKTATHQTRIRNYLKAMEALAAKYPDDDEAQIHYALALNTSASPNDKTYAQQLKGAEILKPILARQPEHPGLVHYMIHLTDYPPLAEHGLDAARTYAKIAPDAPHALHMPSHIFTRVGYWQESIDSNTESARVAKAENEADDELHASDYLVYAHLQLGEDVKAGAVIEQMKAVQNIKRFAGHYALAASPARYMIERRDWQGASALEVKPTTIFYPEAMTHFARAMGMAHTGNVDGAKAEIAKIAELHEKLVAAKDAYWAGQVDIQRQVAAAWTLYAEGKHDEALKAMGTTAEAEDKTEKHPVTPGVPKPAHELYGDMLMDRGMAAEALAAYEATLKKEPNRLAAYSGAARAAEKTGDAAKAKAYYGKVVSIAATADATRTEVADARAYLAKN
jgi:tetratricopeptide (TPR) repeat protein